MNSEPQAQHRWLHRLVGDWTYEGEATMQPGKPPEKFNGSERVRSLGGLWTVGEAQGEMPDGGTATLIMTLGYDSQKKRYVGTWVGSMMTHLWIYDGSVEASQDVLTLEAEGPGMSPEETLARYRDVIEFKSDDLRVLTSDILRGDGTWERFMTATYRRNK